MAGGFFEPAQDAQRFALGFEAGGVTGRVLVVGHEVEQFDAGQFTPALQVLQCALKVRDIDAVAPQVNSTAAQPVTLHDSEIDEVAWVFDQHDVAFIAQCFGEHVEQLLGAMGDEHAVRGVQRGRCGD